MVVPPMYGVWGSPLRCPPLRHPLAYGVEKAPIVRCRRFTPFFSCLENGLVISIEISKGVGVFLEKGLSKKFFQKKFGNFVFSGYYIHICTKYTLRYNVQNLIFLPIVEQFIDASVPMAQNKNERIGEIRPYV